MSGESVRSVVTQQGVRYVATFAQSMTACASMWELLEKDLICSPYQKLDFCRSWLEAQADPKPSPCSILVSDADGTPLLFVPMIIEQSQGTRLAIFMGGTHLNFALPLFARELKLPSEALRSIFAQFAHDAQIDAFYFDKIPQHWGEECNPLLALPHTSASDRSYLHSLAPAAELTLKSMRSAHHLKQLRRKLRKLERLGEVKFSEAQLPTERAEALTVFFEQKSDWCQRMGLRDVFAEKDTQTFLVSMSSTDGALRIFTLHFSGNIHAVFLALQHQKRLCGWASSYQLGNIAAYSPGDLLLQHVVATACEEGFETIDLGADQMAYKTRWLHKEEPLFTAIFGYGWKGRLFAQMLSLKHALKCMVKKSPQLYHTIQKLRA